MRNTQRTMLALLALMALAGGLLTFTPTRTKAADAPAMAQNLTVTEEEPVTAPAKGATLYLGLETKAADSRSAQSDAQQALERLRQGLRAAGVAASDVKVLGYRIGTASRAPGQGSVVWQQVVATISSAERLGPAIDAAVASGATMVQGSADQFEAPSPNQRATAVAAAVRAARSDALAIAGALGEPLGRPTSVEVRMRRSVTPGPRYVMLVRVTFSH